MFLRTPYPLRVKIIVFALTLIIGLGLYFISYLPSVSLLENRVYDVYLRARDHQPVSDDVVIIFIGDDTVNALGSWPLTRDYYATLISILNEYGAKQIVFDLLFSEERPMERDYNEALVNQARQAGNVYLPYFLLLGTNAPTSVSASDDMTPTDSGAIVSDIDTHQIQFPLASDAIFPFADLRQTSKGMGHSNIHLDPDGIIRRAPMFINFDDALYPALGLVVAADYLGLDHTNIQLTSDHSVWLDDTREIPVDGQGNMLINYAGPVNLFENYSLLQVFQSYNALRQGEEALVPLESFKDKIILVGMTATGATDLNPTPIAALYPLVGTQATIISNILTSEYLCYAPFWVTFLEMLLLIVLMASALTHFRPYGTLAISTLLVVVLIFGHLLILSTAGCYIKTLFPVSMIILTFALVNVYLFRLERIGREQLNQKLNLIQDELTTKNRQIVQVEKALSDKVTELERLTKEVQEEAELTLNAELVRLKQERDSLLNEHQGLMTEKAALSEKLEIIKGEAQDYIFSSQPPSPLREQLRGDFSFIIGESEILLRELQKVDRAAPVDSNILITGESGTGKELIARAIHENSARQEGDLVIVNCAAIPSELIESELFGHEKGSFTNAVARRIGKFELANGGTLFLDEIGDMPLNMQAKILRAIQQREIRRVGGMQSIQVDVRLVAATNKNLAEEVKNNTFREDLYHRLNVIPIRLPALRDRKEDIPMLVEFFLKRKSTEERTYTITQGVMNAFLNYSWPGNVRELEQMVERMTVLAEGTHLTIGDLPRELAEAAVAADEQVWEWGTEIALKEAVEEFERQFLYKKLTQYDWNISKTADRLQIGRRNLHKKLRKYGIVREKDADGDDD